MSGSDGKPARFKISLASDTSRLVRRLSAESKGEFWFFLRLSLLLFELFFTNLLGVERSFPSRASNCAARFNAFVALSAVLSCTARALFVLKCLFSAVHALLEARSTCFPGLRRAEGGERDGEEYEGRSSSVGVAGNHFQP